MTFKIFNNTCLSSIFKSAKNLADKKPSPKNVKPLLNFSRVVNSNVNIERKNINSQNYKKDPLIGQSIDPRIASGLLNKVRFNGHGEIISLPSHLNKKDRQLLTDNIVEPLKIKNAADPKDKIRTAAECVIDMYCAIKKSNIPEHKKSRMLNHAKQLYLSNSLSKKTLESFLYYCRFSLDESVLLKNKLKELVKSNEKVCYLTKHNDNYYGRTFDSLMAEMVVLNPSTQMNKNVTYIKNELIYDFNSLEEYKRELVAEIVCSAMEDDPAIWYPDIPEAKNFIENCTPENFVKLLKTNSKIKHLPIMLIAVKYLLISPRFYLLKSRATNLYKNIIYPQKDIIEVATNQKISNRTGINLHYQIQGQAGRQEYDGIRPVDKYKIPIHRITKHNHKAILSHKAIGIGMSGSSNILNFLFISLKKDFPDFDLEQARLAAAALLTYSGGHSINEAYTVFNYKKTKSFKPVDYNILAQNDEYTKNIIDKSFDKLIEKAMLLN